MIKTIMASTTEIDDIELAVDEIKSQINSEQLAKNSIGIVFCHYEFIYSGVLKAICESLPFDTVGTMTITQAVNNVVDEFMFTVTVLTSDTVSFTTALTGSLTGGGSAVIEEAYKAASADGRRPSLIIPFVPYIDGVPTDEYVDVMTRVSCDVPCYGTVALFDIEAETESSVFLNGETYSDSMVMILLYSDIEPRFYRATISPEKILDKPAIITKSEKNVIMEINGRPAVKYFEDLGIVDAGQKHYVMASLPFMLDYGDGTPRVSKVFVGQTPEKYIVCAGIVPEGSSIYVGVFDKEDILYTTGNAVDDMLLSDFGEASCMVCFSCVARSMSLGVDSMAELDIVMEKIGDKLPFVMACSGGEICPTQVTDSAAINRFHNNIFMICVI